ncbi:hypothetical protein [Paenibacillus sanguinis]|uniref:hypothetical protein n=1 Tax=Paenibacillus sanguinis TaxID=225906 RepID=UPI00036C86D0|nr:hypothetical protein [Paenibacillus sanguinis]
MANSAKIRQRAIQLKDRPVCITLRNGQTYVGWISGFDENGVTLSGKPKTKKSHKKTAKKTSSRRKKAQVRALSPSFNGLSAPPWDTTTGSRPLPPEIPSPTAFGNPYMGMGWNGGEYGYGSGAGSLVSLSPTTAIPVRPRMRELIETAKKYMPVMKLGYNAIRSIIPFFNGIKALMV